MAQGCGFWLPNTLMPKHRIKAGRHRGPPLASRTEQVERILSALRYAQTLVIQRAEPVLSNRIALLHGQSQPFHRLLVALRHAESMEVDRGDVVHRLGGAL